MQLLVAMRFPAFPFPFPAFQYNTEQRATRGFCSAAELIDNRYAFVVCIKPLTYLLTYLLTYRPKHVSYTDTLRYFTVIQ